MNKIFSHKVTFQIISVVLVILLANALMQNHNLKEYVYERVDRDLERAIEELEHMNERIYDIYKKGYLQKDTGIDTDHIRSLSRFDREIEEIFNLSQGAFDWYDLDRIEWNIYEINRKGTLTKEEAEYLKSIHEYNKRLIRAYDDVLEENKASKKDFDRDHGKIKKIYKEFMIEASRMAMEEEYRSISRYNVDEEETGTEEYVYIESKKKVEVVKEEGEGDDDKIEDELNDDYDQYDDGEYDLEFEYEVESSSDEVEVKMSGMNFKKDSPKWENRNKSEFQDFVEGIAREVIAEIEKDVEIELVDADGKVTGEYEYDESNNRFEVVDEEGKDDEKEYLNEEYEDYEDLLEFTYYVEKKSSYIKIEMKGTNFERDSSVWKDRDEENFRAFAEEISKDMAEKYDMNIRLYVKDEERDDLARYDYFKDSEEFKLISEVSI